MDGENNGNPYEQMDDLEGKPHYFRKHPLGGSSQLNAPKLGYVVEDHPLFCELNR